MFYWGLYKGKNTQCCGALVAALMLQWAQRLNNVRSSEDCQKLTVKLLFHAVVQVCHLTIYWESRTIKLKLLRGQILTHKAGSLLRVVAQRLRVWGESSGSVHSSGTAVRCGPFPLSQIYKATCDSTGSCRKGIFQAIWMFSSFFYSNCNFFWEQYSSEQIHYLRGLIKEKQVAERRKSEQGKHCYSQRKRSGTSFNYSTAWQ